MPSYADMEDDSIQAQPLYATGVADPGHKHGLTWNELVGAQNLALRRVPQHYGIEPPPLTWDEHKQFQWWQDFQFLAGAHWDEKPMAWYLDQLGDA